MGRLPRWAIVRVWLTRACSHCLVAFCPVGFRVVAQILRIVLNYKREMNWSEIEFKNPEMNEAIQGLFLTIEHELKQVRLLFMGVLTDPQYCNATRVRGDR